MAGGAFDDVQVRIYEVDGERFRLDVPMAARVCSTAPCDLSGKEEKK